MKLEDKIRILNNNYVEEQIVNIKDRQFYNPYDLMKQEYILAGIKRPDLKIVGFLELFKADMNVYDKLDKIRDYCLFD